MADKQRFEVVGTSTVGGHAPGEQFDADPENDQVKFWGQIGAVKPVPSAAGIVTTTDELLAAPTPERKISTLKKKDADRR